MTSPWVAVQAQDIEDRWRPLTDAETKIVDTVISDAQDIVEQEAEVAGITPVTGDDRRSRAYKRGVASMVIRVLKNPDGILSETIDDYTYRYDQAVSTGALYVSDDELARLRPETARRARGAFSIVPR